VCPATNQDAGTSPSEPSDETLARRAGAAPDHAEGRAAAETLLERHQRRVYVWCYRRFNDHERAMEMTQDVLLTAYRSLPRFREESQFTTWLFAICRNRCVSALRSPSLLVDDDAEIEMIADTERPPDQRLGETQDEQALLALMREFLTPRERDALWLRCIERLPVDEVTRLLGLETSSGARSVLQSARRKLRRALDARREMEKDR
jgi:RNA polymerase sigma-70 factor (ECF subfamily)